MSDIFLFTDYKEYLKAILADSEKKVTVSKLAEVAKCQRSYLSKALNSEIHLTPDHAYGIQKFLDLRASAAEYFMMLVHEARAGDIEYKKELLRRLDSLRAENADVSTKVKAQVIRGDEVGSFYYSSWVWMAVHVATSIPQYQTAREISQRLSLSEPETLEILHQLEQIGLVNKSLQKWKMSDQDLHLHKSSPLISLHHQNWRLRAILNSQLRAMKAGQESVHYTTVSSISRKDIEQLRSEVLQFIEKMRKKISSSPEEELLCVNIDFFQV